MYWNGNPSRVALFYVDMMTALRSPQRPAFLLNQPGETPSRNRLHTAISRTLALSVNSMSLRSTDRQPSTAS